MTTDQVVVYGGNDGTAETYNTVTVDRGSGVGQEQLVQQVGYASTATGSLAVIDDIVSVQTVGFAGAVFVLSGSYSGAGTTVVNFERSFDEGVSWVSGYGIINETGAYGQQLDGSSGFGGDNLTFTVGISTDGADAVRLRVSGNDLGAGTLNVEAATQAAVQPTQAVVVAGSAGNVGVQINNVDTTLPVTSVDAVGTVTDIAVASDVVEAQVVAANASRRALTLTNTDMNRCYLKWGAAPSDSDWHFYLDEGDRYELPPTPITAELRAVWAADGTGFLMGCEG